MSQETDEKIAARVQQGDIESFGVLIERYEAKMTRYAKKFLFDGEDSRDIVQEAFIKAYINIRSFDTARKFSSWMYRIAHNELINAIKKRSRTPILPFDPDTLFPHPVAAETADGEAQKKEIRALLDHGLGKIGPKYREALVLYYFEDMDYTEIAEVLEIPVSTVGIRLRRGKAILKEFVAHDTMRP